MGRPSVGLKGYQLATEPVLGTGLLDSRWLLIAVVEFELFFGLWLLAGLLPRLTWTAAVGCFGLFAIVSLYKALDGETSCGCFGRVSVNPWYTLGLDIAAIMALLRWRPQSQSLQSSAPVRLFSRRVAILLTVFLALGVPVGIAMGTYRSANLAESGEILGDGEIVILEPEQWVGNEFPLIEYIDIGEELKTGDWNVLLYHHDCPSCREAIPKYQELAEHGKAGAEDARVALVEMPPYDGSTNGLGVSSAICLLGRLSNTKEWFAETPLEVKLDNGEVTTSGR